MQAQLLRPNQPGPVEGRVRILREGKSVLFLEVHLLQVGSQTAAFQLIFARSRLNSMVVPAAPAPPAAPPDQHDR